MIWKIMKCVVPFVFLVIGVFAGYYLTSLFTTNMDIIRFVGRFMGLLFCIVSLFTISDTIEKKSQTRN